MSKRNKEVLIDPSEEEMLAREPLMAFSFYLSGRSNVLLDIGDEILELLDDGFTGEVVHGGKISRAETLMWLWTLGAYEVIRTISQARECFSQDFISKVTVLKKQLAKVRMPASKMEKQGKKQPVTSNRSPTGWDAKNRDLLINDPEDNDVSARNLLSNYDITISSLSINDVLKRHEESYN